MQIILKETLNKLGKKGQAINVKKGYFMNYLLPQNLATFATPSLLEKAEEIQKNIQIELKEKQKQAQGLYEKLNGKTLKYTAKVSKKGKLYAKISQNKICELLTDQFQITIGPSEVKIKEEIKEAGIHEGINIKLAASIVASMKIDIQAETPNQDA